MGLHELVDLANKYDEYVIGVVESREQDDYTLMCSVNTYEEAKVHEQLLHADGILDTIIVPPFESGRVKPNETADYFRSYFNQQPKKPAVKYQWILEL